MIKDIKRFGETEDGQEVFLYTIENKNGMQAVVTNYGAILTKLNIPDKSGAQVNVVLGYDTLEPYFENDCFFGATVGPNANRIAGAQFVLQGEKYCLDVNDGPNNLHSHKELGYHKKIWSADAQNDSVTLKLEVPDGYLGFPGNKKNTVTYTLTDENELKIHYYISSDKETIINPTNHTYFNLAGRGEGNILGHKLKFYAGRYTPVAEGAIPTGEIASVTGTPMDFTSMKAIGEEIDSDFEQLRLTGGYDHNWVIDGWYKSIKLFAEAEEPVSGRKMYAYTDLPGFQFYAGNGMSEKNYGKRGGFCLETQFFPNTSNEPTFPSSVFGPGRPYESTTIYRFE